MNKNAILDRLFPERNIGKVLLINPPDADASLFRRDTARLKRYSAYPPYGLTVLAQKLISSGIKVHISDLNYHILKQCNGIEENEAFDFSATWKGRLDDVISIIKPDLIGITCMFSMTYLPFKTVCRFLADKDIPMVAGGVYLTSDHGRVLNDLPFLKALFLGESDVSLVNFIQVVNRKLAVKFLSRVIINDTHPCSCCSEGAPPDEKMIDTIPAYELISLSEYAKYGTIGAFYCFKEPEARFATIISNRGCRGKCKFCSVGNFNGPGVRQRKIASVVDELELIQNRYDIDHVVWLDDDLLFNHKRAIALFNEMVRRNLNLTWDATNGVLAASCKDEVIAAAQESGCIALNIGLESGNAAILKEMRKPALVDTYFAAAEVLKKYEKIHTSGFLMLGFPDETMAMIFETITLAERMDLDWYRISIVEPLPGTPLYKSMMKSGRLKKDADGDIRFMGGAYGKQAEIEQGINPSENDFMKSINAIPMEAVPEPAQLTDIWFYMNYRLNFNRLFAENRKIKIQQQIRHLGNLADVISKDNGFALYFLGYLQYKIFGKTEKKVVDRLEKRLDTSQYWKNRFHAFDLEIDDLKNLDFNKRAYPN